jgi:hypothetical protein
LEDGPVSVTQRNVFFSSGFGIKFFLLQPSSVVDRHGFDTVPDPTFDFDTDSDADPTPSFTHVGKSGFPFTEASSNFSVREIFWKKV